MYVREVVIVPEERGTSLLEVLVALTILTIAGTAMEYLVQGTIGQIQKRHRQYMDTMRTYKSPLNTRETRCIPEKETPIILWHCETSDQQRQKVAYE